MTYLDPNFSMSQLRCTYVFIFKGIVHLALGETKLQHFPERHNHALYLLKRITNHPAIQLMD